MQNPIFYFDFGSPNAYLAAQVLPAIEARTGARFRHVPVLLGGLFKLSGNQSPITAYAGIPHKLAYEHLEITRFVARHQLTAFRMNPFFPVNTLMLMRGAVAAEAENLAPAYNAAMYHFMWEDPRKLDDPAILHQTLLDSSLPADRLLTRAQDQDIKDRLAANTRAAYDHGAFGIPSFVVGDNLYFGKDRLRDIEDELISPQPRSPAGL